MFEIKGKYATALITTLNIEEEAIAQITSLVNNEAALNSKIAIMPDVHAGAGCVIGTTMTITDRVVPNLVGVDIGCGVLAVKIATGVLDFEKLQRVIDMHVPSGFKVHANESDDANTLISDLRVNLPKNKKSRVACSLGTLGGGNHFISVESDGNDTYLCIHTGSRYLGVQVAKHYQDLALKSLSKDKATSADKDFAYLQKQDMDDYLHDAMIAQNYAWHNRAAIARIIFIEMGWMWKGRIESVHNYISPIDNILRKGAVAAPAGELFLVPLNMKDGTLICRGKENTAWNQSAPHGAGRVMSRRKAKDTIDLKKFQDSMVGIWTVTCGQSTLDEAPDAYKPAEEIKDIIAEKYEIVSHLKTIFNFKASDEKRETEE